MKRIGEQSYFYFAMLWLIFVTLITIPRIAPSGLNADLMMHSIMSLQNVTLYYWGQNRLLSVIAYSTSWIKNPAYNLATILTLHSLFLFFFIYLAARISAMATGANNKNTTTFLVFVITSSIFTLVFHENALSNMVITHMEYSFPALLLTAACLGFLPERVAGKVLLGILLPGVSVFLAIGVNPATVIPAIFIAVMSQIYRNRLRKNELTFLTISAASFIMWSYVAKKHGHMPYSEFSLEIFNLGINKVIYGLIDTINTPILIAFFSIFSGFIILKTALTKEKNGASASLTNYAGSTAVVFSAGWLFLFSSNRWVQMNEFTWRYFIFILFALIFVASLTLSRHLMTVKSRKSIGAVSAAALVCVLFVSIPNAKLYFHDYDIIKRVNTLSEPGGRLYAGDYWVAWPSVWRDMMYGYEAYGLAFRGQANREAARDFVLRTIKTEGRATAFCLKTDKETCILQVQQVAGPLFFIESSPYNDDVILVHFGEKDALP
jgi:hypothetical protein